MIKYALSFGLITSQHVGRASGMLRGILACRGNFPRKFVKGNKRKGNENLRLFEHIRLYICEYPVINLPLRLNIALKRREILACVVLYQSCKTSWV